jgi:putative transposase
MYRILDSAQEVKERRDQVRRPHYLKPELLAVAPNQVWSWDITKLMGPVKWTYFYLYVILDIFSRYAVGWMVAHRESAALAERLIGETCEKQGIEPGQLTLHADRGTSMTSKPVALLLADLGVVKTHSRPQVSNDNPFSESQFKTMKYRPEFTDRFGSLEDSRAFCRVFFPWYTSAWPAPFGSGGRRSSRPRTQLTPRGSSEGRPSPPPYLRPFGSTHLRKRPSRMPHDRRAPPRTT